MKIEIDLSYEDIDRIIIQDLKQCYGYCSEEPELQQAFLKVLEYYMKPPEFRKEFGNGP
jgi:hypothetical protein